MEFKVKLLGDEKFHEPYHVVEAENARDAAEMWHGGPLTENGSSTKLRIQVKHVFSGRMINTLFYEP